MAKEADEIHAPFARETWDSLSSLKKLDAIVNLERHAAALCGNPPREVRLDRLSGDLCGVIDGFGPIYLNMNLVLNSTLVFRSPDGTARPNRVEAANVIVLETVYHENYHAYQMEVINGRLEHPDAQEAWLWRLNALNHVTHVPDYRIQPLEKSAYYHGVGMANQAFGELCARNGIDKGYESYRLFPDSYEQAMQWAADVYGDTNYEKTLIDSLREGKPALQRAPGLADGNCFPRVSAIQKEKGALKTGPGNPEKSQSQTSRKKRVGLDR